MYFDGRSAARPIRMELRTVLASRLFNIFFFVYPGPLVSKWQTVAAKSLF